MSDESIEPLSSDLRALFDAEMANLVEDRALQARVLAKIELAVTLASPPSIETAATIAKPIAKAALGTRSLWLATTGAFLLGAIAGGVAMKTLTPAPLVPVHDPAPAPSVTAPPVEEDSVQSSSPDAGPGRIVVGDAGVPRAQLIRDTLVRERELVDAARVALATGHPETALNFVARHARAFPNGQMAEEREALWIQGLVKAGRKTEAEARAVTFRREFPEGFLLPTVEDALRPGN